MNVRIRMVDSPRTSALEFAGPTITIGRDSSCEISLPGVTSVSGLHARIQLTPNGAFLSDLGSKNGTYLNDRRVVGQQKLGEGDYLRLGQTGPALQVVELDCTVARMPAKPKPVEKIAEAPIRREPQREMAAPLPKLASTLSDRNRQPELVFSAELPGETDLHASANGPAKKKRRRIVISLQETGKLFSTALRWAVPKPDTEKRWLRMSVAGMLLLLVASLGGLFAVYRFGSGIPMRLPPELAPQVVPEHTFAKAEINGKQMTAHTDTRGLDLLIDDKTPCAFAKAFDLILHQGENKATLHEENKFGDYRQVHMWLTFVPTTAEHESMPELHVRANVEGEEIDFGKTSKASKPGSKLKTEERAVKLKKNGNRISFNIKHLGRDNVPVTMQVNWKDDPLSVDLHVLGVGVSKYAKNSPKRILDLKYADKDAEALAEEMQRQQSEKLFNRVHKKLLINQEATKAAILEGLDSIQQKAREHDLVMLIFAGHGGLHSLDKHFYFLPHDYDPEPKQSLILSGLAWSEIQKFTKAMPCRVIVVMDACHSGGIELNRGESQPSKEQLEEALSEYRNIGSKRGVMLITACTKEQEARERAEWGGGHGALSWSLLKPLLENNLKKDEPIISLDRWCQYAKDNMKGLGISREQAVTIQSDPNLSFRHIPIAVAR